MASQAKDTTFGNILGYDYTNFAPVPVFWFVSSLPSASLLSWIPNASKVFFPMSSIELVPVLRALIMRSGSDKAWIELLKVSRHRQQQHSQSRRWRKHSLWL
jgi:hypothetical protein